MTKVRTAAKRKKEKTLRSLIDAKKTKQAQQPAEVKDLDLASAGSEVVSLEKEQTKNTIMFFKEELLAGIREGIDTELKSLDSQTRQRVEASGLVEELYKGLREGITDELKKYIKDANKSLANSLDLIVDKLGETTTAITQPPVIEGTTAGNEPVVSVPLPAQERRPVTVESLGTKGQEELAQQVIGRQEVQGKEPETRTGKVKNYLERVALGSIGMSEYAEKRIQKRQSLDYKVEIETKLNEERFKGMSQKEIRKTVEKEQLVQIKKQKELADNEAKVSELRRAGYSDADIEKLGLTKTREGLLKEAVAADPSRLGSQFTSDFETNVDRSRTENSERTSTETQNTEVNQESTLVNEIKDIIKASKSTSDESTTKKTAVTNTEENSTSNVANFVTDKTSVSEEVMQETARVEEQKVQKEEEQVIILTDIRDILRTTNETRRQANQSSTSATAGDSGSSILPEIDVDILRRAPKPGKVPGGKPSLASRMGQLIKSPAARFLGGAAAVAGAGYAGYKAGEFLNENVINPGIKSLTGEENLGSAIYTGVDKLQDWAGGWLGKSDKMKEEEAVAAAKAQTAARKEASLKGNITPPQTGDRLISNSVQNKVEESNKQIVVNAPPPTVINNSQPSQIVMQPFTTNIRNREPSISDYLRTRY